MVHIMCTISIVHQIMATAISATVGQTSIEGTVKFLFNKRKRLNVVVVHQLVVVSVLVVLIRHKGKRSIDIFYSFTKVSNIKKTALDFNICIRKGGKTTW